MKNHQKMPEQAEHEGQVSRLAKGLVWRDAVDGYLTGNLCCVVGLVWAENPGDDPKEGCFPRTGGAKEGDGFSGFNAKAHVAERGPLAIVNYGNIFDFNAHSNPSVAGVGEARL